MLSISIPVSLLWATWIDPCPYMVMSITESGNAGESGNDGSIHRNLFVFYCYHGLVHIYNYDWYCFSLLFFCFALFLLCTSVFTSKSVYSAWASRKRLPRNKLLFIFGFLEFSLVYYAGYLAEQNYTGENCLKSIIPEKTRKYTIWSCSRTRRRLFS